MVFFRNLNLSLFILMILLSSCNQKMINDVELLEKYDKFQYDEQTLYNMGEKERNDHNYAKAIKYFKTLQTSYPFSKYGEYAQYQLVHLIIDSSRYDAASIYVDTFIEMYPRSKYIDEMYHLQSNALVHLGMTTNNSDYALKAYNNLKNLQLRNPTSQYQMDIYSNLEKAKNLITRNIVDIGIYYQDRLNLLAALKRFNQVINDFSDSDHVAEAYYRAIQMYKLLNLQDKEMEYYQYMEKHFDKSKFFKMLQSKAHDNPKPTLYNEKQLAN